MASIAIPAVILPFAIFSGYMKNFEDLPTWIGWFQYFSPIKYTFMAFIRN